MRNVLLITFLISVPLAAAVWCASACFLKKKFKDDYQNIYAVLALALIYPIILFILGYVVVSFTFLD